MEQVPLSIDNPLNHVQPALIQRNLTELAGQIGAEYDAAEKSARTTLEHAAKAGELLISAKALCGHGTWIDWLATNFKGSTLTNQTTILQAKAGEHSAKPDEFYQLVESLCPGSKVEIFSRTQRPGWAGYGDEFPAPAVAQAA